MSGNVRLGISNIVCILILSGCTTYAVNPDLPCPERPVLTAIPDELQLRMGEDAVTIVTDNQLALKAYAKKLEARAGCE